MIVETHTFRLAEGVDEADFLVVDKEVQETLNAARGFVRRTTARGADGGWLVVTLWYSGEHADAAPPAPEFDALIADSAIARYESLD